MRIRRSFGLVFLVTLVLLGGLRVALPVLIAGYVERLFGGLDDYELALGDVDVGLWRGAYQLDEVDLRQVVDGAERPVLAAGRIDLSIQWRWLLRGAVVGEVVLHRPILHVHADGEAPPDEGGGEAEDEPEVEQQTEEWWQLVDRLFPFRVDRFVVRDGDLRYHVLDAEEPIDLYVADFYLELLNLTNIRDEGGVLLAQLEAAGRPLGTGEAELRARFDPGSEEPRLDLQAELREIPLPELNDLLLAVADVDVEAGKLSMYTEMAVAGNQLEGYVRTLIEELEVLRWSEIEGPGDALEALWEGLVSLAGEVLEKQPHDRLATRVPLDGELEDVQSDTGALIGSLLRNAFVQALAPALEGGVDLEDAREPAPRAGREGEETARS